MSIPAVLVLAILSQSTPGARVTDPPASTPKAAAPSSAVTAKAKSPPIFKVLVWYSRVEPLKTFNYQEYDLRKNEYTPAVDAWIQKVNKEFPAYAVMIRDVDATLEPGQTEKLKVGSVIKTELTIAAAMSGIVIGAPSTVGSGLSSSPARVSRSQIVTSPISNDRSFLDRPAATFPVPIPYPRPHP